MNYTVNELMVVMKNARQRVNDLKEIRKASVKSERVLWGDTQEKIIQPEYDIKKVDAKIVEIERFIMKADAAIKQSNAHTIVTLDFNDAGLFDPIM